MSRTIHSLFLACAFGLMGLSSCVNEPDYSDTPNISFSGVEQYTLRNPQNALYDSLVLIVHYEDGDGDLGLSATEPADSEGPFASGQRYNNNFFSTVSKKVRGQYQPILVNNSPISFNGRFPRISNSELSEPLEGDIRYGFTIFSNPAVRPGDTLRFDIKIVDRALHESQRIVSSDIIMFSR